MSICVSNLSHVSWHNWAKSHCGRNRWVVTCQLLIDSLYWREKKCRREFADFMNSTEFSGAQQKLTSESWPENWVVKFTSQPLHKTWLRENAEGYWSYKLQTTVLRDVWQEGDVKGKYLKEKMLTKIKFSLKTLESLSLGLCDTTSDPTPSLITLYCQLEPLIKMIMKVIESLTVESTRLMSK